MAITMVIGNNNRISSSIFAPAQTMSSLLANEFAEASTALHRSALTEVALILLLMSLLFNVTARWLVVGGSARTAAATLRESIHAMNTTLQHIVRQERPAYRRYVMIQSASMKGLCVVFTTIILLILAFVTFYLLAKGFSLFKLGHLHRGADSCRGWKALPAV